MSGRGVFIEVADKDSDTSYVTFCSLPVQIGKLNDAGNQLLLDPIDETVSRLHGLIQGSGKELIYRDKSRNGSVVNRVTVKDGTASLAPGWQVEIGRYVLREVSVKDPLVVSHLDSQRHVIAQRYLLKGNGIGVEHSQSGLRLVDLNKWPFQGSVPLVVLREVSGKFLLSKPATNDRTAVTINTKPLSATEMVVEPGNVMEIDGDRFELVTLRSRFVVCGGGDCQLINPVGKHQQCKWCGRDLAAAGGESIVIPAGTTLAWPV